MLNTPVTKRMKKTEFSQFYNMQLFIEGKLRATKMPYLQHNTNQIRFATKNVYCFTEDAEIFVLLFRGQGQGLARRGKSRYDGTLRLDLLFEITFDNHPLPFFTTFTIIFETH